MAQKLAECYYDEDVVNEDLSCHPHPRKGIQMLLKLQETLMTENKLRLLCTIRKVHEILRDIRKSVGTAAETVSLTSAILIRLSGLFLTGKQVSKCCFGFSFQTANKDIYDSYKIICLYITIQNTNVNFRRFRKSKTEFFQRYFPPFLQVTSIKISIFSKDMLVYYNNNVIHIFLRLHIH